jgi:hypothetical protein
LSIELVLQIGIILSEVSWNYQNGVELTQNISGVDVSEAFHNEHQKIKPINTNKVKLGVVLTHLDTSAEFLQKYLSSESL